MSSAGETSENLPSVRIIGSGENLWSMSPTERLSRMFARIGITDVAPWNGVLPSSGECILVSGQHVYAQVLLSDLVARPGTLLTADGRPVAAHCTTDLGAKVAEGIAAGSLSDTHGLTALEPGQLSSGYNEKLRKYEAPYVTLVTPDSVDAIEKQTFAGSYKGVTDFVTLYLWPKPALAVTRFCARLKISPNTVTSASLVLVLMAMWLFWNGHFLTGLVCAWLMTFLDTVDGKLARVTVTSTKWGNVYDHGIDLVHPPFWYWAWFVGVATGSGADTNEVLEIALWITIIGYVLQRVQEGIFIAKFKMEMHVWRKFDSIYRLYVARRNPNLVILTLLASVGLPGEGLVLVAVWTAISLVVHTIQILQAFQADLPLKSWLDR